MGPAVRLTLTAFLMLFVELALIRWLGATVVYLAYFSNIVLLGSFLGIGLGFLWAGRSPRSLYPFTPLALAGLVIVAKAVRVRVNISGGDLLFFGVHTDGPSRWLVLPVVFVVVAGCLMCIGDGVARCFPLLKNLDAYQWDLIGSLLGIVGFTTLSFLGAPPVVWGGIASVVLVATLWTPEWKRAALIVAPLVPLMLVLGVESFQSDTMWTPYYKARSIPINDDADQYGYVAEINGVPTWLQEVGGGLDKYRTSYDRMVDPDPGRVLIIGAGSGNDVAVAIEQGATHIDAVEIDPRLLELGRDHPNRPYDSPIVDVHIDDGRAFLERSDEEWDTILLALPDSLTLLQGQSAIRLESYLFTEEAVEAYLDHLAPDGVFSMYNYYRQPWLVERYAGTVEQVFGTQPCVGVAEGTILSVLTASPDPDAVACPNGEWYVASADAPAPVTDDRPFPYLRTPSIPTFYLVSMGFVLLLSLFSVRVVGGPLRGLGSYIDLFFMGVAFLLLETTNVVQFALLFGTTWFVNALVFAGVLLSVLAAVAVSKRVKIRRPERLYIVLLAGVALNWLIPGRVLLDLPSVPRFLVAVLLAFFPIFTANLVFAERFRDTVDSTTAFGANLLGAMVGGVLEYTALRIGYSNLLVLVAVVYGLAFLTRPGTRWSLRFDTATSAEPVAAGSPGPRTNVR